ncbi:peptidase inhibitor family I36 protein [Fodinicola feengrottensis]|uniref:peptidase inhibitor family I36 protein n=1 Tax=Fodinicola feengrottensis TaxID=435914 RepID=UPI0036F3F836
MFVGISVTSSATAASTHSGTVALRASSTHPAGPAALPSCPSGDVCIWSSTHFTGTRYNPVGGPCGTTINPPSSNFGSFINNQTGNAPTTFYNSSNQILLETQGYSAVDDVGVAIRGHVAHWKVC